MTKWMMAAAVLIAASATRAQVPPAQGKVVAAQTTQATSQIRKSDVARMFADPIAAAVGYAELSGPWTLDLWVKDETGRYDPKGLQIYNEMAGMQDGALSFAISKTPVGEVCEAAGSAISGQKVRCWLEPKSVRFDFSTSAVANGFDHSFECRNIAANYLLCRENWSEHFMGSRNDGGIQFLGFHKAARGGS